VIGGHCIGVVAGLIAYHAIAPDIGVSVTTSAPALATAQLRFVASGVVAVVLTTGGMLATETVHPPACATTLIVSLGYLVDRRRRAHRARRRRRPVAAHRFVRHGPSFGGYGPLEQ